MNYQAFSDDSLSMMHHAARGALAVDDELTKLGEEPRFRVRDTSDWKTHADDLEAEMRKRGMIFDVIDWAGVREVECVSESATLQPEAPQPDRSPPEGNAASPSGDADDRNARLRERIAAVIKIR
jgi:hypothetical protein